MLVWLLLVIELSAFGLIGRLLPPLAALTSAPNLARHGVILPFSWFGGVALLQFWDGRLPTSVKRRLRASAYPLIALAAILLLLLSLNFQPLLALLGFPPATITRDDAAALAWLRENTPADAVVMAADGNAWLPVFAERRATDIRAVRYFEWDLIKDAGFGRAEVDYVFVTGGTAPPENMPLELAFEQGPVRVYKQIER